MRRQLRKLKGANFASIRAASVKLLSEPLRMSCCLERGSLERELGGARLSSIVVTSWLVTIEQVMVLKWQL